MDINCDGSIMLISQSIPSCTYVVSSSLSLYIGHAVRLSSVEHCLVSIFCPSNVWCWITSYITVKSEISSFKNKLVNWYRSNHRGICIVNKSYMTRLNMKKIRELRLKHLSNNMVFAVCRQFKHLHVL